MKYLVMLGLLFVCLCGCNNKALEISENIQVNEMDVIVSEQVCQEDLMLEKDNYNGLVR